MRNAVKISFVCILLQNKCSVRSINVLSLCIDVISCDKTSFVCNKPLS